MMLSIHQSSLPAKPPYCQKMSTIMHVRKQYSSSRFKVKQRLFEYCTYSRFKFRCLIYKIRVIKHITAQLQSLDSGEFLPIQFLVLQNA